VNEPTDRPAYFDQLRMSVEEIARTRWTLRQVAALADESPGLTAEQIRDRLTVLAAEYGRRP